VRVWRISERALVIDERQPKDGDIIAFSMDSRHAVIAGEGDTVRVWDLATRMEIARVDCCAARSEVAFDRNGTDLVLGRPPAELLPWDTKRLIEQACAHIPVNLAPREFATLMPGETYHRTCPNVPVAE
jgi:hypothetical protein